jgi:hypothetical protein
LKAVKISDEFIDEIITSKVIAILGIEDFLIQVLSELKELGIKSFPPLLDFVQDFNYIINSLVNKRVTMSELSRAIRLDQVTLWSDSEEFGTRWNQRWLATNPDNLALAVLNNPSTIDLGFPSIL